MEDDEERPMTAHDILQESDQMRALMAQHGEAFAALWGRLIAEGMPQMVAHDVIVTYVQEWVNCTWGSDE